MTTRFYPIQAHANFMVALIDMVKWLINDGHALTGPNWVVIEAWDSVLAGGTLEQPGDGHDLDSFTGTFSWRTGALGVGDWVILQSDTGVAGTKMEVYLEYDSATTLKTAMIPLDNWVTGAASASPPTTELNSVKAIGGGGVFPAALVSVVAFAGLADYTIVADEAMMALLVDNSTSACAWIYIGEVTPARLSGTPADDRPYVIMDTPASVGITTTTCWNRLSPLDDTTVLETGYSAEFCGIGPVLTTGNDVNPLGLWLVLPVGVYFHDASHRHFAGILRNIGECSPDKGSIGTIDTLNWFYRNDGSNRGVCFAWDGVTAV